MIKRWTFFGICFFCLLLYSQAIIEAPQSVERLKALAPSVDKILAFATQVIDVKVKPRYLRNCVDYT